MEPVALHLVETKEVGNRAVSILDTAKTVKVVDPETYTAAGFIWKSLKDMMKEVDEAWDKNIKLWHEGHKNALADKARYYQPLDTASRTVKKLMSDYNLAQERIRIAEQRRLEEIALKAEEERLLQEAIVTEAEARASGASKEEAAQEAAAIIEKPVYVPPIIIPKEVPKVTGMSFRTIWKFRIIDIAKIPREYLEPDMVKIGGVVRALKGQTNIPGIRVYEEKV